MELKSPEEIGQWISTSTFISGYSKIFDNCLELWSKSVAEGKPSLPPGLFARLNEQLTGKQNGINSSFERLSLEKQFIQLMTRGNYCRSLHSEFVLDQSNKTNLLLIRTLDKILEKYHCFFNLEMNFSPKDLDLALQSTQEFPTREDYENLIINIYSSGRDHAISANLHLEKLDLFEIKNPDLFDSPISRSFFSKTTTALEGIRPWLDGFIQVQEEEDHIVKKFGEPSFLPLGGYDSLTTRGNFSSLLPSELAYIDTDLEIDYFDYKFIEKELLYFKREEGAVFRIRRAIHLSLDFNYKMEHERNLAYLLAYLILLMEKMTETFSKDILLIGLSLYGTLPSELNVFTDFLDYYINSMELEDRVIVEKNVQWNTELIKENNYQQWFIGVESPLENGKMVNFEFPDTDKLHRIESPMERYRLLAKPINELIKEMIYHAHR